MDNGTQFFPTEDDLEIGNYSLTILKCDSDKRSIHLIKESSHEIICEAFEDNVDKGLGEIYNEYQRGDYPKEGLETFLRFYFEFNKHKAQKMISET